MSVKKSAPTTSSECCFCFLFFLTLLTRNPVQSTTHFINSPPRNYTSRVTEATLAAVASPTCGQISSKTKPRLINIRTNVHRSRARQSLKNSSRLSGTWLGLKVMIQWRGQVASALKYATVFVKDSNAKMTWFSPVLIMHQLMTHPCSTLISSLQTWLRRMPPPPILLPLNPLYIIEEHTSVALLTGQIHYPYASQVWGVRWVSIFKSDVMPFRLQRRGTIQIVTCTQFYSHAISHDGMGAGGGIGAHGMDN